MINRVAYSFPISRAAEIAVAEVTAFLADNDRIEAPVLAATTRGRGTASRQPVRI